MTESANDEDFLGKVYALRFYNGFVTAELISFLKACFTRLVKVEKLPVFISRKKMKSMHFVEKEKQNFRKENVIDVIRNVSTLIQQSKIEVIGALLGAERYELATSYKRFPLTAPDWHSWPEKASHVDAF